MDQILNLLFIPILLLGLAILTNLYREHRQYRFELKPNCLLTRRPVVFLTGPRSIFYFRKYWNAYPEILAEHGYEVFTLLLPWKGSARIQKMKDFLERQKGLNKKFHFICDGFTELELRPLLTNSESVASVTVMENKQSPLFKDKDSSRLLYWAYLLHVWNYGDQNLPVADELGVRFPSASTWLLEKMQEKGEQDFLG